MTILTKKEINVVFEDPCTQHRKTLGQFKCEELIKLPCSSREVQYLYFITEAQCPDGVDLEQWMAGIKKGLTVECTHDGMFYGECNCTQQDAYVNEYVEGLIKVNLTRTAAF